MGNSNKSESTSYMFGLFSKKGNVVSTGGTLGPFSEESHAGMRDGAVIGGHSRATDVGFSSNFQSHEQTFGHGGMSETNASGWTIGGVGCQKETTTSAFQNGNVFSTQEKGNFFGHEYKFGFNIPMPHISAPNISAPTMSHLASDIAHQIYKGGEFLYQGGAYIGQPLYNAAGSFSKNMPNVPMPDLSKVASGVASTSGHVYHFASKAGPAACSFFKEAGPVIYEGGKVAAKVGGAILSAMK